MTSLSPPSIAATPEEQATALALYRTRRDGVLMTDFPGPVPTSPAGAYRIQDAELALMGARPRGWKVAGVRPEFRDLMGTERTTGPIMAHLRTEAEQELVFALTPGCNAAIEAEFVLLIGQDIAPDADAATQAAAIASVHMGAELAGSPCVGVAKAGPLGSIADHGNTLAVVMGPALPGRPTEIFARTTASMVIDGAHVADGTAAGLPVGGPLGSLAWLVGNLAARGLRLHAGDWVATGALTGVHPITIGQSARIGFDSAGFTLKLVARG